MSNPKVPPHPDRPSNLNKDPDEWTTDDERMTDAPVSYFAGQLIIRHFLLVSSTTTVRLSTKPGIGDGFTEYFTIKLTHIYHIQLENLGFS